MSIAYLVMCHKNPGQVNQLIGKLLETGGHVYVHIDAACDDFPIEERENVFIIPKERRIFVRWAGISMMDAEIVLLQSALEAETEYSHFVLLSGEDYPIKSERHIDSFLKSESEYNFIDIKRPEDNDYQRYEKRNQILFPEIIAGTGLLRRVIKNIYVHLTGGYKKTFGLFCRKNKSGLDFYYGSQWWVLNRDTAKWVCQYLEDHTEVRKFFTYSLVPDECMMQSLVMKSPFKECIKPSLTYVEWGDNRNHPNYLSEFQIDGLRKDDRYLFARKVKLNP